KMLIGIGPRGSVLGERLKHVEIALCSLRQVKISLHHSQLVVPRGGLTAHFDVSAEENRRLSKLFFCDSEIRQFQQSFGEVWIGAQCLLEEFFRGCVVSLTLLNITNIEKTRSITPVVF